MFGDCVCIDVWGLCVYVSVCKLMCACVLPAERKKGKWETDPLGDFAKRSRFLPCESLIVQGCGSKYWDFSPPL